MDVEQNVVVESPKIIALSDAKTLFLRDVQGLAKQVRIPPYS